MISELKKETINTWFDLGMLIDRLKESPPSPARVPARSFEAFMAEIESGVGFVTFYYSIDGVTMEVLKYAKVLKRISPRIKCHFISGRTESTCEHLFPANSRISVLEDVDGFDKWEHYDNFFSNRLERGAPAYNKLIEDFWAQCLEITERMADYITTNDIRLLYLINTNSNPGNVALALSTVLVSKYMGIPVISNNHDFYWEGGSPGRGGPRHHFFTNHHLGEVFALIETLFPWESPRWLSVNINNNQSSELVATFGHNVKNVAEIGTAVDTNIYRSTSKRRRIEVFFQLSQVLSGYKASLAVTAVDSLIKKQLEPEQIKGPLLLGRKASKNLDFTNANLVLLQPTRIVGRKVIEMNFTLIEKLFVNDKFRSYFEFNPALKVTLMVTGPIADGHFRYFRKLLKSYKSMLKKLPKTVRDRVHLAFLFSEFDKSSFTRRFESPLRMPDLYNVASMICLPSETEGRGLPIIESAASGIPILCRRYAPENVYAEVIGEHLREDRRLKVCEFRGDTLHDRLINEIITYLMHPHTYNPIANHNRRVVESRFSLQALGMDMEKILRQLFTQLQPRHKARKEAQKALEDFNQWVSSPPESITEVLNTRNRQYLSGTHQLSFMVYLKSLIDPSFFRVEEQMMRGQAMVFAKFLMDRGTMDKPPDLKTQHLFFNKIGRAHV